MFVNRLAAAHGKRNIGVYEGDGGLAAKLALYVAFGAACIA